MAALTTTVQTSFFNWEMIRYWIFTWINIVIEAKEQKLEIKQDIFLKSKANSKNLGKSQTL